MGYRERLARDIERWQSEGLIDTATAQALARSSVASAGAGGFQLSRALALMGALLLGAGMLTLAAANWGDIPRPVRVGFLILLIWAGFLGGAWRLKRRDPVFGHALLLAGAAAYGAAILLIGAMYHLHGSSFTAFFAWAAGTLAGALLMRSGPLAAAGAVLSVLVLFGEPEWQTTLFLAPVLAGPVLLAGSWVAADRAGGVAGKYLVLAGLVVWSGRLAAELGLDAWVGLVVAGLGAGLYHLTTRLPALTARYTRMPAVLPGYGLACAGGGFLAHQILASPPDGTQGSLAAVISGTAWCVLALGVAVYALLDRGREHAGVRWVSYGVFAAAIAVLALDVIGSRLGTAGLFAVLGLAVMALAALVVRTERLARGPGLPATPSDRITSGATP